MEVPGRDLVNVMPLATHQASRWWLMNSEPLSESMPRIGNGNAPVMSSSASNTHFCALLRTLRFSVQPVAMSVTVSV